MTTELLAAVEVLARLPLGGEAMYRGELVRKVRIAEKDVSGDVVPRCRRCPLFDRARHDSTRPGDDCDIFYTAHHAQPCSAAEARYPVYTLSLARVRDIPGMTIRGELA